LKIKGIISKFFADSKRIFTVSRKPSKDEYKRMALIIALGIVIIGVMGFIIQLIFNLLGLVGV
jgi:protein transport protein SEC61 subunit gamma and related proteins